MRNTSIGSRCCGSEAIAFLRPAAADDRGAGGVLDFHTKRGYPPYDEDAYCLGPDTPFKTVFPPPTRIPQGTSYSNVVSMLLVGGVLEAVEGPLCVLCIFACAVPCGAAYHSLWKPARLVRGASGGVYGDGALRFTMFMNWHDALRYFRLLACVLQ